MSIYGFSNAETVHKLLALADSTASGRFAAYCTKLEQGAIAAVKRYGHYSASKMLYRAGFPIHAAARIIQLAMLDGYRYRRPNGANWRSQKLPGSQGDIGNGR